MFLQRYIYTIASTNIGYFPHDKTRYHNGLPCTNMAVGIPTSNTRQIWHVSIGLYVHDEVSSSYFDQQHMRQADIGQGDIGGQRAWTLLVHQN